MHDHPLIIAEPCEKATTSSSMDIYVGNLVRSRKASYLLF
jgi:hypothetical protein